MSDVAKPETPVFHPQRPNRKERKVKTRIYDSSGASSQAESSSSESDDDEKISIQIRPKSAKNDSGRELVRFISGSKSKGRGGGGEGF